MRASTIDWISHGNMPINSVDVQPRGYRILTGGSDNKVCIWNLLPIISKEFELRGKASPSDMFDLDANMKDQSCAKSKNEESKIEIQIDQSPVQQNYMNDNSKNDRTDETSLEFDAEFQTDVESMSNLFEKDEIKSVKKLAELSNHEQPVNCVRWNSVGTFFASGGDDGRAILWEFKGHKHVSKSQDIFANAYGGGLPISQEDFKNMEEQNKDHEKIEIREDWQAKKIWRNHQSITDLTWAPDSLHFASCGTDSRICIYNINVGSPLQIIDSKSNGLTFDPFGKFLASQSSEEKSVKIWRVQNFRNVTLETEISSYYKAAMGMSINRRLSWSSDGSFISTTGGRVCGEYLVPLLERSTWKLAASLSGHRSSINISRINPRLYKTESGALDCYSIVAIVSQDSTISVWKPQLTKPFAVMMDFCMMGVTDLSWGFNGNILLSSSHDGKVAYFHFKPGTLGEPCTELEKREIIKKRYGNQVLQDYVKNATTTSQQKSQMNQLSAAHANPQNQHVLNQAQKVTVNAKTGKKKIIPKVERIFDDSNADVNPHMNPFLQLNESGKVDTDQKKVVQPINQNSIINKQTNKQNNVKEPIIQNAQIQQRSELIGGQEIGQPKLPSISSIQKITSQAGTNQNLNTIVNSLVQPTVPVPQAPIQSQNIVKPNQPIELTDVELAVKQDSSAQKSTKQINSTVPKAKNVAQKEVPQGQTKLPIFGQAQGQILMKQQALQSQKPPTLKNNDEKQPSSPKQNGSQNVNKVNQNNQANKLAANSIQNLSQVQQNAKNQSDSQFIHSLQQIFDSSRQLTAIPLEQYKSLFHELLRDELQIVLPKDERDIFGEELRVLIQSLQINVHQQKICLKVYNAESQELSALDMHGERVVLVAANSNFFCIYTNKQLLHVFSSATTELIKRGVLVEGVCMISQNKTTSQIALLTLKESVRLEHSVSILDVLRAQHTIEDQSQEQESVAQPANDNQTITKQTVYLQSLRLLDTNEIQIFLSNGHHFIYEKKALSQWKKMPSISFEGPEAALQIKQGDKVRVEPSLPAFENVFNMVQTQNMDQDNQGKLSKLISLLDQMNQEDNNDLLIEKSDDQKIMDLKETLDLFEGLCMKVEFLQTLRTYTICVFQTMKIEAIKELLARYGLIEGSQRGGVFVVNKPESVQGLLFNFDAETCVSKGLDPEQFIHYQNVKKNRSKVIQDGVKKYCGIENTQLFKDCILPVLKVVAEDAGCNLIDLVKQIVEQICLANTSESQQPEESGLIGQINGKQSAVDMVTTNNVKNTLMINENKFEQTNLQQQPQQKMQAVAQEQVNQNVQAHSFQSSLNAQQILSGAVGNHYQHAGHLDSIPKTNNIPSNNFNQQNITMVPSNRQLPNAMPIRQNAEIDQSHYSHQSQSYQQASDNVMAFNRQTMPQQSIEESNQMMLLDNQKVPNQEVRQQDFNQGPEQSLQHILDNIGEYFVFQNPDGTTQKIPVLELIKNLEPAELNQLFINQGQIQQMPPNGQSLINLKQPQYQVPKQDNL